MSAVVAPVGRTRTLVVPASAQQHIIPITRKPETVLDPLLCSRRESLSAPDWAETLAPKLEA